MICNIANNYFIEKIKAIRREFLPSLMDPINILKFLKPRNINTLVIPEITCQETAKFIKNLKSSHATGHDNLNSKLLKKMSHLISPHITHLINCCIRTNKFPIIYKIARILPLLKKNKNNSNIENYRPISNLCVIEKILESPIQHHLVKFFESNDIIDNFHYGGHKGHSTTTATLDIYNTLLNNKQDDNISVMLITDGKAAFDTIDISILLKKLEHYGVRGGLYNYFSHT